MKSTSKTVIFAVALALATQVTVNAVPISNEAQTQLEEDKNVLKEVEEKKENLEISIEKLDNQIEAFMMKIDENKKGITQTEKDINKSKEEIIKIEEEVKNQQDILDSRIRSMYKNGQSNYLKILLEAEGFSDVISRIESITKIINIDQKVISDLDLKKVEIEEKKAFIENKHNELIVLETENENKLVSLNNDIASQKELVNEIKKQEQLSVSKVNESQALVDETLAQVKKIRSEAPNYKVSRGTASVSDSNIIAYASNFLGIPYLWGGTSPSTGFDCSGFTQYVYAHFGIRIGRTTYDQINDGYEVPKNQLQAGDLVFFGTNNNPTHMGIYVGNNTYIHSPRTGEVLKISPMTRTDYITGRRVK
jgi:cell wall-associated NlpC family hydrolase